jgi:hypothetical protein
MPPVDLQVPVRRLRLQVTAEGPKLVEAVKTPLFIKGPISVAWLSAASKLPGKALNVALAIQWLAGMSAGKPFKLTRAALAMFAVSADAAQDALPRLEAASLISAARRPGQRPLITVLKLSV